MTAESPSVTRVLVAALNDLNEDQQFSVLRQIVREDLTSHILRLCLDLSESRKKEIICYIEESGFQRVCPEQDTLITLEEREHERVECDIIVECTDNGKISKHRASDLSLGGMKILTSGDFSPGSILTLSFSLPGISHIFSAEGLIVQQSEESIGIQFTSLTQRAEGILNNFFEKDQQLIPE